jgi:OmpA-OmpF porin, OOP family
MKHLLTLLGIIIFLVSATAVAQQTSKKNFPVRGQIKPALFGIAFNLSDFNAPKNFGSNSNGKSLSIKDMSQGFSLYYWKGLTPAIDFSAKLNGIFHDYSAIYYQLPGKTEIGLELEPTINIRPIKDENLWAPFLTAGVGMGLYTNHIGAYIPLGAGLQLNASSTTYFFLQAQFKLAITTKVLDNNLFYSLGFAQNISSNKNAGTTTAAPAIPAN